MLPPQFFYMTGSPFPEDSVSTTRLLQKRFTYNKIYACACNFREPSNLLGYFRLAR
ncbi:hypothetical protein C8U37_10660 [Trichococcus patagoniensis]|uniref:Uncharacterized protein n=1 Tax=Trichococcus patagoniensis TaxID=382641 RepID=A0A2T5IM77_9LACT|nr:hypothetical protein C8U37_10660 [Trichococcus patagoniensis]